MKKLYIRILLIFTFSLPIATVTHLSFSQHVGFGTTTPTCKVHITGSTVSLHDIQAEAKEKEKAQCKGAKWKNVI